MAAGGRVLGEAFIVISPDADGFLQDLTAKVKAAVTAVPQQNVKVGADTTPMTAAMTRVRSELAAVTARVANIKFGADDTAISAAVAKMLNKVALLDKQMRAMELAADPAKMDAAIARESVKLKGLQQELRNLQMGADTTKIDTAMAREVTAAAGLQQKLDRLQLTLNDAEAVYELKYLQHQAEVIRKALEKIPGDVEDTLLNKKLDVIVARISVIRSDAKKIALAANTTLLFSQLTAAEDKLMRLRAEGAGVRLMNEAQITRVQAAITETTAEIGVLRAEADRVRLGGLTMAEVTSLAAGIAGLNDDVARLNTELAKTQGVPTEALTRLREEAARLSAELAKERIDLQGEPDAEAKLTRLELMAEKLRATLADQSLGGDPVKLAAASAAVAALALGIKNLTPAIAETEGAWAKLQGWAFKGGGGLWGLGGAIGGVSLWHVALDGVIEAIIAVTGAVIAASAGIAVLAETGKDVATRLQAVRTVNAALGTEIPPLTGKFDSLVKSMAPRGIEIFGGALNLINSQSQNLQKVIEPVIDLFDKWVAEIDIWVGHQQSFAGAVTHGTGYLQQFGQIIGQITEGIHNLLTKDPGIAHYLLDILSAAAGLFDAFTKLPKPLVELTIGLHGVIVWAAVLGGIFLKLASPIVTLTGKVYEMGKAWQAAGALAKASAAETAAAGAVTEETAAVTGLSGALGKAGGALRTFGAGLAALAANPFVWAAAAIALIAGIVYEMNQASRSANDLISGMNAQLNQMKASDAIPAIEADIGKLNDQIQTTFSPANISRIQGTFGGNSLISLGRFKSNLTSMGDAAVAWGHSVVDIFSGNAPKAVSDFGGVIGAFSAKHNAAMHQAGEDIKRYDGQLTHLKQTQGNYFQTIGALVKEHYSVASSFALMDLAGVKASDSFEVMHQKVENLITGYKSVTGTGGALENSVNAVTFAALQQQEKVGQLNQGWDTFMKTITGGEQGFNAFASQTEGLYQTLSNAGVKLSDSNGKVSMSTKLAADAAQGGKVSMTGLNTASLQARDTFLQTATAANTQMDNLSLLANAAGKGQQGVNMLNQANKDMVATMLPAAKGSQAMTDVLYALAQRGGYTGRDSFKALAEWVGKTKDPMKQLDGITTTLTTDASNLAGDVKNLSVALGTTLNDAMSQAIITANGGQAVFVDFATAVLKTGLNSGTTHDAAQKLAQSLVNLTGNTTDAHKQFLTFAQVALHLTHDEAETLWNSFAKKLTPALNDAASWAKKGKDDFEKFAGAGGKGGLGLASKEADTLWGKLSKNGLGGVLADLANSKAPNAKTEFEKLAGDKTHGLGLTHAQADKLWTKLHGDLGKELGALAGAQGSVPQSKKAFEEWAGAGGKSGLSLTTKNADALYTMLGGSGKGGLKQAIDNLPTKKTITITANTTDASKNVDTLQQRLNKVSQEITSQLPGGHLRPGLQHGGLIMHGSGPTADDVPLMASRGEFMMRAAAVSKYGVGAMEAINAGVAHPALVGAAAVHRASGGLIGYAAGGAVTGGVGGGGGGGGTGSISLAGAIAQLSGQLQTLFTQKIPAWLNSFATLSQVTFTKITSSMQTTFAAGLSAMFTTKMPGWLTATETSFRKTWGATAGTFHDSLTVPVQVFFTSTVPGWLTTTGNGFRRTWTQAAADFRAALVNPVQQFFTATIPADFQALDTKARQTFDNVNAYFGAHVNKPVSTAISAWSGDISNAFRKGWNATAAEFNSGVVNWINANILKNLPGSLSVQKIPQFAGGGIVSMGSGPAADDVHALLSRGEVVVPAGLVSAGAVDHLRGKLPGFAAGGYVNPVGRGAVPGRIDMGVDYTGTFDLYALGAGTIRNLYNSGWPGGTFITLQLADGKYAGDLWYYAEHIQPSVRVGQAVRAGDKVGHAPGGSPWTELGWAANAAGTTEAAATGQAASHGDAGGVSTAYGVIASNLIASLGGPAGIMQAGGVRGKIGGLVPTPMGGGSGGLVQWQVLEGLLDSSGTKLSAKTAGLSQFVQGGAKQLLSLAQKGAQAIFDEVWKDSVKPKLNALPQGTMPGAYIRAVAGLLDKGISGYMKQQDAKSQQQAATMGANAGGGFINPVSGPADASPSTAAFYARGQLGAHGWGAAEWGALQNLWVRESGFSRFARNPSSGAYGIAQALPPTKYPLAGQAGGGSHASPQVDWGLNYIKGRYGSPGGAWAHEVSNNWYAHGGVIPEMVIGRGLQTGQGYVFGEKGPETVIPGAHRLAAGGVVTDIGALRSRLSAAQRGEQAKYSGLAHDFAAGPARYRTAVVRSELVTLAARQAAEEAAYRALAGTGLTTTRLHHLGAMARSEARTAADQALSKLPGGHPGFAADLRSYLGQISILSGGSILPGSNVTEAPPSGSGTKLPGGGHLTAAQTAQRGAEYLKAWQTRHGGPYALAIGPKVLNEQIPEMQAALSRARTLAGAQGLSAGQHRFWSLAAASESRLLATLDKEIATERGWRAQLAATDATLTREIAVAGTLPSLAGPVMGWKAQLARHKRTILEIDGMIGWSDAHIAAAKAAAAKAAADKVAAEAAARLAANPPDTSATAPAGPLTFIPRAQTLAREFSFDRGGILEPGWNPPMFNGTGAREHLVPAGGGDIHVHIHNDGVIGSRAELDNWLNGSIDRLARNGRLGYAFKRSFSAT